MPFTVSAGTEANPQTPANLVASFPSACSISGRLLTITDKMLISGWVDFTGYDVQVNGTGNIPQVLNGGGWTWGRLENGQLRGTHVLRTTGRTNITWGGNTETNSFIRSGSTLKWYGVHFICSDTGLESGSDFLVMIDSGAARKLHSLYECIIEKRGQLTQSFFNFETTADSSLSLIGTYVQIFGSLPRITAFGPANPGAGGDSNSVAIIGPDVGASNSFLPDGFNANLSETQTFRVLNHAGGKVANYTFDNPEYPFETRAVTYGGNSSAGTTNVFVRTDYIIRTADPLGTTARASCNIRAVNDLNGSQLFATTTDANGEAAQFLTSWQQTCVATNFVDPSTFTITTTDRSNVRALARRKDLVEATALVSSVVGEQTLAFLMAEDVNYSATNVAGLSSISNAVEAYDAYKEFLDANMNVAAFMQRSGNALDFGDKNVVVDATASSLFAFSGTTLTIKASTFTGDMTTTGVITLANGATFNGVRTDANGTVDPGIVTVQNGATYTSDAATKFVVNTNTVTSFTISGFIPTLIEKTGSGSTTVIGINNAKLTTTTITGTGTLVAGDGLNPSANWVVSNGAKTITLSTGATEANLLGLRGLAAVNYTQSGSSYEYTSDYKIIVNGTLTIDPEVEALNIKYIGQANPTPTDVPGANVMLEVNGNLTIGREIVENELTRYSEGMAVYLEDTPDVFHTYMNFTGTSNVTWYGGTISMSHGCVNLSVGAEVLTKSENARFTYRGRSANNQLRLITDDFVSEAFTFVGGDLTLIGVNSQINGYRPIVCTGAIAHSSATPNVDYVLRDYAGGDQGNERDVKQWQGNRTQLYNSKTGTQLKVGAHVPQATAFGTVRVYSELDMSAVEFGGGPVAGAKLYIKDYNNGNRRLYNQEAPNIDLTSDLVYTATSNAGGIFPTVLVMTGAQLADLSYGSASDPVNTGMYAWDYRSKNGDTDDLFDVFLASYNHFLTQVTDASLKGVGGVTEQATFFVDTNITQSTKATVDAYTTLETPQKFYDRAKSYLVDNYAGQTATLVSRSGTLIDAGSYNVTIDATAASVFAVSGNTITIKASTFTGDMTTTGLITLANGAVFVGTRTDANGTVAPPKTVSVSGLTAGSRLRVYNDTTSTEVVNEIVAGTSYTATYSEGTGYTTGDVLTLTATWQSGATAKLPWTTQVVVGSTGWSALASQQDDTVYNAIGVDGGAVTEFAADYPNVQVDINDGNGETSVNRLYAWFVHVCTTADGIRNWFGGILAEDAANFRINTSVLNLKLDNVASTGVTFTGGVRLYRSDGAAPVVSSTSGGGSITLYADKVYVAETGVSGLTAGESAKLDAIAGIDQNVTTVKKVLVNKRVTNPSTGQQIIYDDDNTTTLLSGAIYEDVAGTQTYRGQGVERADRLT